MGYISLWLKQFKVNDKVYLDIQTIVEDKVKSFLTDNNAMKLLEFALATVTEGLRQDPSNRASNRKDASNTKLRL